MSAIVPKFVLFAAPTLILAALPAHEQFPMAGGPMAESASDRQLEERSPEFR
jgi:hypothetical protein